MASLQIVYCVLYVFCYVLSKIMRRSMPRTGLGKARLAAGLKQKELAALLSVPISTINNIENERCDCPEELAADAASLLGADLDSILENQATIKNLAGRKLTPKDYETHRARLRMEEDSPETVALKVNENLYWDIRHVVAIVEASLRRGEYPLFAYRLRRALNGLCKETRAGRYVMRHTIPGASSRKPAPFFLHPHAALDDWNARSEALFGPETFRQVQDAIHLVPRVRNNLLEGANFFLTKLASQRHKWAPEPAKRKAVMRPIQPNKKARA